MLQYAFLQHATPMPSHDTTRGLIQLTSKLGKWSRKVTLLHSTGNNRSFPLPTELRTSTGLSGTFPTRFPLHKGVPSLLYSPSMTSPYQCQFLSSKHQVHGPIPTCDIMASTSRFFPLSQLLVFLLIKT
jgi:hypothetical protein